MVTVEKMEELGAIANFWKARITVLRTELALLHDMKAQGRTDGDRYAADRLLREIKRKTTETVDAEQSLRRVKRALASPPGVAPRLLRDTAVPADSARSRN